MAAVSVALWRGVIPVEWLTAFGYKGLFILSLVNGIAPVAGPSQIATFFAASKLNPLLVGITAGVGGAIGELAGYGFGYSFRASQSEEFERKFQRFGNWWFIRISRERSFIPLFVLASVPNPFFDPLSALAGSLRIPFPKYFIPVLLGKTLRHVIIAYAGYYAITGSLAVAFQRMINMTDINSIGFIGAVVGIAFFAWLVRSFAESEPDPLLLNFTFFAFVGQCVLTAELIGAGKPIGIIGLVLGLDLLAAILVLIQVGIIKEQVSTTIEHYETLLRENRADKDDIEQWAAILLRITGVDFFPEFYEKYIKVRFLRNSRERRRKQAVSILPPQLFEENKHGITAVALTVKPDDRKWLWRLYAGVCAAAWILFIVCIGLGRVHQ